MACIMKYLCGCIGVDLTHATWNDGDDWSFEDDDLTVRDAGEAKLAGSGDVPDDCYCSYTGEAYIYKDGIVDPDDPGYERHSLTIEVMVHSSLVVYVTVSVPLSATTLTYSVALPFSVLWKPLYWNDPAAPPCVLGAFVADSPAWPYSTIVDPVDFEVYNVNERDDTLSFAFSHNQDICKTICETSNYIDSGDSSYPLNLCGTGNACPAVAAVPWPWNRDRSEASAVVIEDESGIPIALDKQFSHTRLPYFTATDYGDECVVDVLDVGRGWDWSTVPSWHVDESQWWVINQYALNGWTQTPPSDCPPYGWYQFDYPCEGDTYYYVLTFPGEPQPDLPYFKLVLPCSAQDTSAYLYIEFKVMGVWYDTISGGGAALTIGDITAEGGESIPNRGSYVQEFRLSAYRGSFEAAGIPCSNSAGLPEHKTGVDRNTVEAFKQSGATPSPTVTLGSLWWKVGEVTLDFSDSGILSSSSPGGTWPDPPACADPWTAGPLWMEGTGLMEHEHCFKIEYKSGALRTGSPGSYIWNRKVYGPSSVEYGGIGLGWATPTEACCYPGLEGMQTISHGDGDLGDNFIIGGYATEEAAEAACKGDSIIFRYCSGDNWPLFPRNFVDKATGCAYALGCVHDFGSITFNVYKYCGPDPASVCGTPCP